MGQVLPVFAHCKEAPSTASSTPDSTEGGNDDSDFRELHTAREFSEDEEEETTSQDWGTPRELTFSYIAFDGVVGSGGRRDSVVRRPRPQGRSVSEPRDPPPQPSLGDSLESIPSLSQSPEPGRRGDPDTVPPAERPLEELRLRLDQLGWAVRSAGSGEDSATSSSTPLENEEPDGLEASEAGETNLELRLAQPLHLQFEGLTPQLSPSSGIPQAHTPSPQRSQDLNTGPDEPLPNGEGEHWRLLEQEPITAQCLNSTDQSEFTLEPLLLVADLLYWKDTRTSGAIFTGLMASLLCLLHFSIVSVAAHLALLGLCATISLRVYRKVLQAVHRGDGTNPFQAYLDMDLTLTREQTERLSQQIASHVVSTATQLRHFFLVEDLVDSLKLALLFYILTFVGAIFNGLTLVILGVVALFTVPLLYRQHQAQIDQYVGLVTSQLSHIKAKIRAKIPGTGTLAPAASVSGSKAKAE
ncbi:reticulon-2 [Rattus norvegicus]|uniref:Reticulon-2 n=2 Tax=Rattus norvegicus TaxID=10116 RepID=RTN2_RAT|nr:reticulon-2 [Rattus norvegicus]Q6WN19.1 RecName: Full=Reticulon-2; AltName: Full=Neuroendocrine-specific protein-like 1; Short=NSP-like protein 1; AltName: Full=Neuroendocrine-specific protein-like I; Short=NSP-like protein I; Short=NSPLI [Rattus norvegicus]AAI29080.1 Reticulon 2 [Rattus norvegicus]AAQ18231.1 reticulon 2 [Rattus norvegicus]DAA01961.2 TPA_inf: RTN2-B [Rattus norvegicus]|eukprot:NP_963856.1 reticulon-2 [Rattus norvegicus]